MRQVDPAAVRRRAREQDRHQVRRVELDALEAGADDELVREQVKELAGLEDHLVELPRWLELVS